VRLRQRSVWFVVPAQGRLEVAAVCLRQLARTCEQLEREGVAASAVVVADDENLDTAAELGFATVRRRNDPLGRKWNDGYQLACDPALNRHPAGFVVPLGTDDWVDPALIMAMLDGRGEMRCTRGSCVVREDGRMLATLSVAYGGHDLDGGDGVRMLERSLLERVGYRPAENDVARALDTSVLRHLTNVLGRPVRRSFHEVHPWQIVDFKSAGEQLNSYAACLAHRDREEDRDPFGTLARFYPREAVDEMAALYGVLDLEVACA
jgi:hypothetical protein